MTRDDQVGVQLLRGTDDLLDGLAEPSLCARLDSSQARPSLQLPKLTGELVAHSVDKVFVRRYPDGFAGRITPSIASFADVPAS